LFDFRLWIVLVGLYVSSVMGVTLKFYHSGVRGTNLWLTLVIPLFVVIIPLASFLTVYVPWFNRDIYIAISKFRNVARDKFKFYYRATLPLCAVFTTLEFFPLFTSYLAREISEAQRERICVLLRTVWKQTGNLMIPHMIQKLSTYVGY
jgi:hypothetical protein